MVREFMKKAWLALTGAIWLAAAAGASGQGFVSARGTQIVDGAGRPLLLRGINLGNWLVPEGYMLQFKTANSPRLIDEVANELLGPEEARAFWVRYQDSFVTRDDIVFIHKLGFNSVRAPFHHRWFGAEATADGRAGRGFELLDRVIRWCKEEGLLVLLDLHCAPGGQTGDNIDDGWGYPFLFESEASQAKTAELWGRIAARYKNETALLGYDLLNEPIAHFFDKEKLNPKLEPLYQRVTRAVRRADGRHLIFLGGAQWDSNFKVFGKPFDPGLVYTFHKYWTAPTKEVIQDYLDFGKRWQVPIYMGESGENENGWIRQFRETLEANSVGWCFWPYKKVESESCVMKIKRPANYQELVQFADAPRSTFEEIRKARDAAPKAAAALLAVPEASRFSANEPNRGYIEALGMKAPR
jgi:hypothetical protein